MPHRIKIEMLTPNAEAEERLRLQLDAAVEAFSTAVETASASLLEVLELTDAPAIMQWRRSLSGVLSLLNNMIRAQFERINGQAMEWQVVQLVVMEIQAVCIDLQAQIDAIKVQLEAIEAQSSTTPTTENEVGK